jgi:addiction module RelE/StbE family toxin
MARKVVWTTPAEEDLENILAYWIERNGSKVYSRKLYDLIKAALARTTTHPFIGRPSDIDGIRVLRVEDYLIFYEVIADANVVHHIWDGRRDLERLEF